MDAPKSVSDVVLILRRPEVSATYGRFSLPRGDLSASLLLEPARIRKSMFAIAPIVVKMPRGLLSPARKRQMRRLCAPRFTSALRLHAVACEHAPELTQGLGITWPDHLQMHEQADLTDIYQAILLHANQGTVQALDFRLLFGALQWFLLERLLVSVVRRLEDEKTSPLERQELLNSFAGLLLRREQIMMTVEQRRALRDKRREELAVQTAAASRKTKLLDTLQAMHMGIALDQTTLEEAAEIFEEEMQQQAAKADRTDKADKTSAKAAKDPAKKPRRKADR